MILKVVWTIVGEIKVQMHFFEKVQAKVRCHRGKNLPVFS